MGWRERDYHRNERGVSYRLKLRRTTWAGLLGGPMILVATQAAGHAAARMLPGPNRPWLDSLALSGSGNHPVHILTHPFAARSLLTVVAVLVTLAVLARLVDARRSTGHLLGLYLAGGLLGGAAFWLVAVLVPTWATLELAMPIGALAALALDVWRTYEGAMTSFFGLSAGVRTMVAATAAVLVVLNIAGQGAGCIAWLTALAAGALAAPLLEAIFRDLPERHAAQRRRTAGAARRAIPRDDWPDDDDLEPPVDAPRAPAIDIDDILAKISRSGLSSLTDDERRRLEEARRARLERSR